MGKTRSRREANREESELDLAGLDKENGTKGG
jgi:hypothetical protein